MADQSILRAGPTVILVGGHMTVDDGTSFDSRQQVENDDAAQVTLRALATSPLWWRIAISVVTPILKSAGEEAFALVMGPRSLIDLRADGSLRRTSLRSMLPGGVSKIELISSPISDGLPPEYEKAKILRPWNREQMGDIGFKRGEQGTKWRFLKGKDYFLPDAMASIAPTVIVDTTPPWPLSENFVANNLTGFEGSRLFSPEAILVAPHTSAADSYFKTYVDWVSRGRPPDSPIDATERPEIAWDPDARPDPVRFTTPVPIAADFSVTGLIQDGRWKDPADFEASRALLEARYDLKIGIWDLASNPTLRQTLLDSAPIAPAPLGDAPMPTAATRRAEKRVDERMHQRATELSLHAAINGKLAPLYALGWLQRSERERWNFVLPLSKPFKRFAIENPRPLLQLELWILKRRTEVGAFTDFYFEIDLDAYVEERRGAFEKIAADAECSLGKERPILWKAPGGWGDDVNWDERALLLATLTARWVEMFADPIEECLRRRAESR